MCICINCVLVCVCVDSCGETEQILSCAYVFFFSQDTVEKICIKEIGTKQRLVPKIQKPVSHSVNIHFIA